jgi:hypothetical protein
VGAVYERALLTLSVTGCSGVTQGFIGIRKLSLEVDIQVHRVSWTTWSGGTAQVFFRQRLAHTAIVSENSESIKAYPLLSRGWTLQKRLLATRTLHILPYELLWECKCEYWCECMGVLADQVWKIGQMRGSNFNNIMARPLLVENPISIWPTLVEQYSRRSFTKLHDKLQAFSGVIKRFSRSRSGLGDFQMWR